MSDDTGILSLDQAADALAPADDEPERDAQAEGSDDDPEIDREAPDSADSDPTNADADDTPAKPLGAKQDSVEPPTGWTAEDQAWFKTLPPDRQDIIVRRERDLRANESRRHNEHVAARQAVEAEAAAARTERQMLSHALKTYANPLLAEFERDFADLIQNQTDPRRIQEADPTRFQKLQAYEMEFNKLAAADQAIRAREAVESDALWQRYRSEENARLTAIVPELKDGHALRTFDREVTSYLREAGIPDNLIRNASATQLQIVRKAMLYDKAMAAKPAARPLPKVQRPGTAAGRGERVEEGRIAALRKLERSGSIDDAIGLLRA